MTSFKFLEALSSKIVICLYIYIYIYIGHLKIIYKFLAYITKKNSINYKNKVSSLQCKCKSLPINYQS